MDALDQYGSSDSEDSNGVSVRQYAQPVVRQYKVDTAPDTTGIQHIGASSKQLIGPEQREMMYNMGFEQMTQPLVGPSDSDGTFASKGGNSTFTFSTAAGGGGGGGGRLASGTVERQAIEESTFRQQERMFKQQGRAHDPSVGAQGSYITSTVNKSKAGVGSKRKAKGDPGVARAEGAYQGPWARFEGDSEKGTESGPTEAQLAEYEQRMAGFSAPTKDATAGKAKSTKQAYADGQEERTVFHAQAERDYQGRTYMHVPADLQHAPAEGEQTCAAPARRLVKEWKSAHAGGVSAIRFIPQSGHLLLSCGMDGL
ncbi:hypothetical protein GGI23_007792, partial [Coemansia sp. RSA 2559]